ncbi:VOC family protein [Actinokineospora bangkokensis]|uniref:Bleomycin resistance protein n=1 Tax=Actinokineospora bangkokensis TaxID=1193682 RepID=A0A1Q9LMH7_9PSEU|nr:VOC family protein [Actinokineospora bangkokensis]OLR93246.1 bleomycin resistance protein [Actinokineospora bangkokensis]
MACVLRALCVDAHDPAGLARFWAALLGWETTGRGELTPTDDTGFGLRFTRARDPKATKNRMHFDLTSATPDDQRATVEKAIALGGGHVDIGQRPDEQHVVLADPEGNEFCVIEAGNQFLADCGPVGALACDGTRAVGLFWQAALDWPLVWDQGEETAIRSPRGGTKITWGGPPLDPRVGRDRVRFDLAPLDTDLPTELARLVALGATARTEEAGAATLVDPDGNEFHLR